MVMTSVQFPVSASPRTHDTSSVSFCVTEVQCPTGN